MDEYVGETAIGYYLLLEITLWRNEAIVALQTYVQRISTALAFSDLGIPIPITQDLRPLLNSFLHEDDVYRVMAHSRSYFVDLAGFYCWLHAVFIEDITNLSIEQKAPILDTW